MGIFEKPTRRPDVSGEIWSYGNPKSADLETSEKQVKYFLISRVQVQVFGSQVPVPRTTALWIMIIIQFQVGLQAA